MKCSKCGAEIEEGKLYCSVCGAEVQLVPEYDTLGNYMRQKEREGAGRGGKPASCGNAAQKATAAGGAGKAEEKEKAETVSSDRVLSAGSLYCGTSAL